MTVQTGLLGGRFSYVRLGDGRATLMVLPGMALDNGTRGGLVARSYGYAFRRLARHYTVYVVQRPRHLTAGMSTRDLAAGYAGLLRAELGPVKLVGLSTGGAIAQHLALDHPSLVERLALVVAGSRLSEEGRRICERWRALAEARSWRRLRGELAAAAVDGAAAQRAARVFGRLTGGSPPESADSGDFAITIQAMLAHDTTADLSGLGVPTLVIGGGQDPFYPESALRETAGAMPSASLRVVEGSGHGLPKHQAAWLQEELIAFFGD